MVDTYMNLLELTEEINIEFSDIDLIIKYIIELREKIGDKEPYHSDLAAIIQYVVNFYNGVEIILKRISKYHKFQLPYGADSHIQLFQMFDGSIPNELPILFNNEFKMEFIEIRKFRHFAIHGYAFKIKYTNIKNSLKLIENIYNSFKTNVLGYLDSIRLSNLLP
jgi:hypothetical protein